MCSRWWWRSVTGMDCKHQWSAWGHELRGVSHVQVRYCKCGAMQVKPDKK